MRTLVRPGGAIAPAAAALTELLFALTRAAGAVSDRTGSSVVLFDTTGFLVGALFQGRDHYGG